MTTEQLYKKADKADEVADLDLTDVDPKEIITAIYEVWLDRTLDIYNESHGSCWYLPEGEDRMYDIACKIIKPFADKITGDFNTSEMSIVKKRASGLYLSALHNHTRLGKLTISSNIGGVGRDLPIGKTLEICKDINIHAVGTEINGGTIINYGEVDDLGSGIKSGNLFNYGKTSTVNGMGAEAESGNFFNYGTVSYGPRIYPKLGQQGCKSIRFFNFGTVEPLCDDVTGVLVSANKKADIRFIDGKNPWDHFPIGIICLKEDPNGNFYAVGEEEFKNDKALAKMVEELRVTGHSDIPKAETLARKVDERVRANYKPKMVAPYDD